MPTISSPFLQIRMACALLGCLLSIFWLAACSSELAPLAEAEFPAPAAPPTVMHEGLELGPIEGFTTGWHAIADGSELAVPRDAVLDFRYPLAEGEQMVWSGAVELPAPLGKSLARVEAGRTTTTTKLEAAITDVATGAVRTLALTLRRVDLSPAELRVTALELRARSEQIYEEASNPETMRAFYGGSLAPLVHLDVDHWRGSTHSKIEFSALTGRPEESALLEWRVDGEPLMLGARSVRALLQRGAHRIEVGPPGHARSLRLDLFDVEIVSHEEAVDVVGQGVPVSFEARTLPAGYEDEIVWLASTRDGSAEPTIGRGASFTTTFADTWNEGHTQWLGVKANYASFNQDKKIDPSGCPGAKKITCIPMGTSATVNNLYVQFAEAVAGISGARVRGTMSHAAGGELTNPEWLAYDLTTNVWIGSGADMTIGENGAWAVQFDCVTGHEINFYVRANTSPTVCALVCVTFICP